MSSSAAVRSGDVKTRDSASLHIVVHPDKMPADDEDKIPTGISVEIGTNGRPLPAAAAGEDEEDESGYELYARSLSSPPKFGLCFRPVACGGSAGGEDEADVVIARVVPACDSSEDLSSDWGDDDDDEDDEEEVGEGEEGDVVAEVRRDGDFGGAATADVVKDKTEHSTDSRRQSSGWRTVRNIVHLAPFFQTYKKQRYPWVQLAGHQGNFKSGEEQGTILKKLCGEEERCLRLLSDDDALKPFVPEYKGRVIGDDGDVYLVLQDLLAEFSNPCVMDCKMGLRTYLEEELAKAREKPKLRKDMYEKMCQIDPDAPTQEEHDAKAVTKPRYMVWRETISSTATLGFRIDGIKKGDGESSKDFKTTRSKEQVMGAIESFVRGFPDALKEHLQTLLDIEKALGESKFFAEHELIGSSLLFVHDASKSGVWLIDFAKTFPIPDGVRVTHSEPWVEGSHEDGYLIGLHNLVDIFSEMSDRQQAPTTTNNNPSSSSSSAAS